MKIAIIGTRGIPAKYGGFETAAEEIAIGLVRKGNEIAVYCRYGNGAGNLSEYKGVKLIYIFHIDSKNLGTFSHSFLSFIHSIFQNYEIILAFNVGIAPLCIIPRLFGKKIVLNVDGLEWKRRKWGWLGKIYFLICERISKYCVDQIITDSRAIKKYYKERYNISSIYIPYGAHIEKLINLEILKRYGVKKGEYFFVASRLEPENNADLIIKAFCKLKTQKKLLIAGGANYNSTFVKRLKEIKDGRIRIVGPVYTPGHIEALHIGCYAYIHGNEVGGTNPALLKAMGYGNCILALNVPYNSEVIGESAILFDKSVDDLCDT